MLYRKYFKRLFDFSAGLLILTLVSPLIFLISITNLVTIGRPVFFLQRRPGRDRKIFSIIKFRTMSNAKDEAGNLKSDGERLTRSGRILRVTSLDELPELINVVKGEMSLVGPRPLLIRYLPYFTQEEDVRHQVRPGITGWAQVNGRNVLSWDERLKMDIWYTRNISLWIDIKIIVLSFLRVLQRKGVHVDPTSMALDLDVERSKSHE